MVEFLWWDREELKKLIQYYEGPGSVTLKATYNSQDLWEAKVQRSYGQVLNIAKDTLLSNRVSNSFDRIGATELNITEVMTKETKKTTQDGWEDWFLKKATLGYDSLTMPAVEIVPDTNFIMRRYASGLLRRLGETRFGKLRFRIPNLVILEIEAIYNRAKKTSEALLESAKSSPLDNRKEQELNKALFDSKEALIATKELMFLREKGAIMLESNLEGTIHSYSEISGKAFMDMYIRKEIRDTLRKQNLCARFSTCDLMNALSAVAEGLPTLYFSRLQSEKFYLSSQHDTCLAQISELVLDTTVLFGEIKLTSLSTDKSVDIKTLKAEWAGWTIEDLLNNRIIEERSKQPKQ